VSAIRGPIPSLLACGVLAFAGVVDAAEDGRAGPQVFRDCPACPEMVILPAGTFLMGTAAPAPGGADRTGESGPVVIRLPRPFAIGRYEVTRREFAEFVEASGHEVRPGCESWDDALGRFHDDPRRSWVAPGRPAEPAEAHPASCLSWTDAQAYARWLAQKTRQPYRLPSEAEWEYAARAGTTGLRYWGDDAADGCGFANAYDLSARAAYRLGRADTGCTDGYPDLAPVGQLAANAFGLHDTIGNVAEWVEDCATGSYVGRPADGRPWTWLGGCSRRVLRGGSWISSPDAARVAARASAEATQRSDQLGFRVALDLDTDARGERR